MTRRQLTMFVPEPWKMTIEQVRRVVDPIQSALIQSHVTLCREEEIECISVQLIEERLVSCKPIVLQFAGAEVFGGHGIFLRCLSGQQDYHSLRSIVLGKKEVHDTAAHITLAHPRNPRAPGNSIDAVCLPIPLQVRFDAVSLIEQVDHSPWRVLRVFSLVDSKIA